MVTQVSLPVEAPGPPVTKRRLLIVEVHGGRGVVEAVGDAVDVSVGVDVDVDVDVDVGVGDGVEQSLLVITFESSVTAASRASNCPVIFACVVAVMEATARRCPTKTESVPNVAELPTVQYTLQA